MGYLKTFLEEVGEAMGVDDLRLPESFIVEVSKAIGQEGVITSLSLSVASRMIEYLNDLGREQLYADDPVFAGMCRDFEREVIDGDKIAIPSLLPSNEGAVKYYSLRRDKKNLLRPRKPCPIGKVFLADPPRRKKRMREPNSLLRGDLKAQPRRRKGEGR